MHGPKSISPSEAEWIMMQISDSSLPVGGFNHSNGLESCWKQGMVNAASLDNWIEASVNHMANTTLPLLTAASTIDELAALDDFCHAHTVSNHVALRASTAQGMGYLSLCQSLPLPLAKEYRLLVLRGEASGHLPIAFALVCQQLEISIGIFKLIQKDVDFFLFTCISALASPLLSVWASSVHTNPNQRCLNSQSAYPPFLNQIKLLSSRNSKRTASWNRNGRQRIRLLLSECSHTLSRLRH